MKKFMIIHLSAIAVYIALTAPASACDFCLLSQGISPLDTSGGSGIRVSERYTLLDRAYRGRERIPNPGAREEYWTTEFTGFFAVTDDLTLLFAVPLRKTAMDGELNVTGGTPVVDPVKGGVSGAGDAMALGRYTFFKIHTIDTTVTAAGIFGMKFPTGKTDAKALGGTEYLDSHLQPGTGSTDFLLGLSLSRAAGKFSLSANTLGVITTAGETGDASHQFGNALNYDLTGRYRVYPGVISSGPRVFLALGLNGELRAREEEDGIEVKDSGGHTVYITPGVQLAASSRWQAEFSYQRPVYHNLHGTQMGETGKAVAAVTYLF
ncbi:MAG: transporter [Deltaproteobacteria bacterium]|nr:transporter [Deltaproteobacteria bacterium]